VLISQRDAFPKELIGSARQNNVDGVFEMASKNFVDNIHQKHATVFAAAKRPVHWRQNR